MNIVDASGWLEYFGSGSNRECYRAVIQNTKHLIMPTISIYEVFQRILVQSDEEEAFKALGWMARGRVVELTQEIAIQAAIFSVEEKLPMTDCLILATTRYYDAELWTQDEYFKGFEKVHYFPKAELK